MNNLILRRLKLSRKLVEMYVSGFACGGTSVRISSYKVFSVTDPDSMTPRVMEAFRRDPACLSPGSRDRGRSGTHNISNLLILITTEIYLSPRMISKYFLKLEQKFY